MAERGDIWSHYFMWLARDQLNNDDISVYSRPRSVTFDRFVMCKIEKDLFIERKFTLGLPVPTHKPMLQKHNQ